MLKLVPIIACLQMAVSLNVAADVTVSDVEIVGANQQEPFDKTVTIKYRLAGTYDSVNVTLSASSDGRSPFDVPVTTVSGAFGEVASGGIVTVNWNLAADWPGMHTDTMKVRVRASSLAGDQPDAKSTATSARFRVDTRPIPPLTLKRSKKTTGDGRSLITYESAVTGVPAGAESRFSKPSCRTPIQRDSGFSMDTNWSSFRIQAQNSIMPLRALPWIPHGRTWYGSQAPSTACCGFPCTTGSGRT